MAATHFGLLAGVVSLLFVKVLPQPLGSLLFWGAAAIHLAFSAVVCWQRAGLPFVTAGMVVASAASLIAFVLAIFGGPLSTLSLESSLILLGVVGVSLVFIHLESRVHAAEWRAWKQSLEERTVWDVLTLRHIPELRQESH